MLKVIWQNERKVPICFGGVSSVIAFPLLLSLSWWQNEKRKKKKIRKCSGEGNQTPSAPPKVNAFPNLLLHSFFFYKLVQTSQCDVFKISAIKSLEQFFSYFLLIFPLCHHPIQKWAKGLINGQVEEQFLMKMDVLLLLCSRALHFLTQAKTTTLYAA